MVNHHLATAVDRYPLTEAALCAWVGQASPGDQLIYHRGFLSNDTAPDSRFGTPAERKALRLVADRAWRLAQDGAVHLLQRRDGPGEYSYLIVVRRRPRTSGGALKAVLHQAGLCRHARVA